MGRNGLICSAQCFCYIETSHYICALTLSWWRVLSYWNQSIDLLFKSVNWFLYDMPTIVKEFNQLNGQETRKRSRKEWFCKVLNYAKLWWWKVWNADSETIMGKESVQIQYQEIVFKFLFLVQANWLTSIPLKSWEKLWFRSSHRRCSVKKGVL